MFRNKVDILKMRMLLAIARPAAALLARSEHPDHLERKERFVQVVKDLDVAKAMLAACKNDEEMRDRPEIVKVLEGILVLAGVKS